MSTPSDTWNSDTVILPALSSPAPLRSDRDTPLRLGTDGESFTGDCTVDEPESSTCITNDCALEFLFSGDSLHPVRIICTTHDWTGVISE